MTGPLFTWIDVEIVLHKKREAGAWPTGLVGVEVYPDAVVLRVREDADSQKIEGALNEWFGLSYAPGKGIELAGVPEKPRHIPVEMEITDDEPLPIRFRPSFRHAWLLPEAQGATTISWPPPFPAGTPPVFVFHSFKGGVGRTLHLIALLKAFSSRFPERRALVIDADLEAPGLTPLVHTNGPRPMPFSLLDFLALVHTEGTPEAPDAMEIAQSYLATTPLHLDVDGRRATHYFLPAYKELHDILRIEVRPEHLIQVPNASWHLAEAFGSLGRAVKADLVLIDLRAGASELAGPLLFDPRVQRFLVSTAGTQSIEGTLLVLEQLAKLAPLQDRIDLKDPIVLLTMLPAIYRSSREQVAMLRERLWATYPVPEDDPPRLRVEESYFSEELLVLRDLNNAIDLLGGTTVERKSLELLDDLLLSQAATIAATIVATTPKSKRKEQRRALANHARSMEFAESGQGTGFLVTPQIRGLGERFARTPPVAVVLGAKGSGKTYTYLQVVGARYWSEFLREADFVPPGQVQQGWIWPLLQPVSLQQAAKERIDACVTSTAQGLHGGRQSWSMTKTVELIDNWLRSAADPSLWRIRWFDLIAQSLGIEVHDNQEPDRAVIDFLNKKKMQIVVVIDGLEERFSKIHENESQQIALRALLQDVPRRLLELPNVPLGLLIFVRPDIARAAIPQNFGQFEHLYDAYQLRWNATQALRLAVWLCLSAGVAVALPADKKVEDISTREAKNALIPVWGSKLGSEDSREPDTSEWVIAALSDYQGQLQARDLVRLLRHAAEQEGDAEDRLLVPTAVRKALPACSEEKIAEIQEEVPALRSVFTKLRRAEHKRIPFQAEQVGIDSRDVELLEEHGVVLRERGALYMPEIFRHGLHFKYAAGARPRVLSLAKKAVEDQ